MKFKTLLFLNEFSVPGSLGSGDADLISWDGIREHNDWFVYKGSNNWNGGKSYCSVTITEGDKPHKYWMTIKTKNLRRPKDTNESYNRRAREMTEKVSKAWVSLAKRLHKEPREITECGNLIMRNWKECFSEALNDPKINRFTEKSGEGNAPIMDPVNFTLRLQENIITGTNLPEIIMSDIESGNVKNEDDVIDLLNSYAEDSGLDNNDSILNSVWKWFKQNERNLLG